jgi:signal transduction histidine kinase
VEAHGGRLWAESATSGAVFHFTVPLLSVEQVHDSALAHQA